MRRIGPVSGRLYPRRDGQPHPSKARAGFPGFLNHLELVFSGRLGNGAWGSAWYQNATDAMSSCKGR